MVTEEEPSNRVTAVAMTVVLMQAEAVVVGTLNRIRENQKEDCVIVQLTEQLPQKQGLQAARCLLSYAGQLRRSEKCHCW